MPDADAVPPGPQAARRVLSRLGLRVLLVDNYDSFTHNLAQALARLLGRDVEVVRNDALDLDALAAAPPDALVLSPGPGSPDVPADIGGCAELLALLPETPTLGVCLGMQVMARAAGADVVRAPWPMHGRLSPVRHDASDLFAGLPDPLRVVRYHSLVVEPSRLPSSWRVTAWSEPAEETGRRAPPLPMALAHAERPLRAVQFHPESILTEGGEALLANFLDLAALHKRTPRIVVEERPGGRAAGLLHRDLPYVDAERAFVALHANDAAAFWLDGNGRFSYLGEAGRERVEVRGDALTVHPSGGTAQVERGDAFALLSARLLHRSTVGDDRFPFSAGYVGWLGYEIKRFAEGGDGPAPPPGQGLPDALLLLADRTLALDNTARTARLFALVHEGQDEATARRWLEEQAVRLLAAVEVPPPEVEAAPAGAGTPLRFTLDADGAAYRAQVARIHELLLGGDTYEICLTTQARAPLAPPGSAPLDALRLHRVLRRSNPAPYSAYLRFPGGAVVSASPERFVKVAPDGAIESRPIKGTRPRGATPEDDARLGAELAAAEKDRAENLMIVDLVRNDLGRVCRVGSVHVPSLMEVEAHPAVFQLVSTVRGLLRPEVTPLAAVRALFPGGSMTGAPKIRAMRILGELEGRPRGVYSGGLGTLGFDGALDLAMCIRTVVLDEAAGELSFGVGGAVVALSEAEDEYREALLKGRALARAVAAAWGRTLAEDDPFA